jgi:hypothetical protein
LHGIVLKMNDRAMLCSESSADCLIVLMALIEAFRAGLAIAMLNCFISGQSLETKSRAAPPGDAR